MCRRRIANGMRLPQHSSPPSAQTCAFQTTTLSPHLSRLPPPCAPRLIPAGIPPPSPLTAAMSSAGDIDSASSSPVHVSNPNIAEQEAEDPLPPLATYPRHLGGGSPRRAQARHRQRRPATAIRIAHPDLAPLESEHFCPCRGGCCAVALQVAL